MKSGEMFLRLSYLGGKIKYNSGTVLVQHWVRFADT